MCIWQLRIVSINFLSSSIFKKFRTSKQRDVKIIFFTTKTGKQCVVVLALKTRLGKFFWKMLGQLGRSTDQIWLA